MARPNRGAYIETNGQNIKMWAYNFRVGSKRFQGWLGPVSEMSKRKAQALYRQVWAKAWLKINRPEK